MQFFFFKKHKDRNFDTLISPKIFLLKVNLISRVKQTGNKQCVSRGASVDRAPCQEDM